jgi:aminoglycoside phosphotransferase (APT) family kinase protein
MNTVASFLHANRERLDTAAYRLNDGFSSLVITPRFRASSHVIFILIPKGTTEPTLVAKMPRLKDASESLAREAAALQTIQGLHDGKLNSIPRVIAFEEYRGYPILVETALNGVLMDNAYIRRHFGNCCDMVVRWLHSLQPHNRDLPEASVWFARLAQAPLNYFAGALNLNADELDLLDKTQALIAPLQTMRLPFVVEHGDLSHPNLIVSRQGELGVVDWELASAEGLPGYDLFFFLAYAAFARQRAQANADYISAFHQAYFEPNSWARPYVKAYLHQLGIDENAIKPLFVLSWARYVIQLLQRLDLTEQEQTSVADATADWLRGNRFFALWRHAVTHADQLEGSW